MQVQPEPLPLLEPGRAKPVTLLDLTNGALGEARLIPARVIEIHVIGEPARMQPVTQRLVPLERRKLVLLVSHRSAAEIDANADAGEVHDRHRSLEQRLRRTDVLVQIDEAALLAPLRGRLVSSQGG